MSNKNSKYNLKQIITVICFIILILVGIYFDHDVEQTISNLTQEQIVDKNVQDLTNIPEYDGNAYVIINNDKPNFDKEDYDKGVFEKYSELDSKWGRCGVAYANICKEIMPDDDEKRESIASVKPTGWKQKEYPEIVDGDFLYHRCHLIGWQLAGENANKYNLITGTQYMNETMLIFENIVDNYFDKTENKNNHVLYRVTPIFQDDNLVASGVQMEAYSIEDDGEGVCFNVYIYNVQPNIVINYKTGESWLEE